MWCVEKRMSDVPIIGVFEGGGIKGVALAGAAAATMDAGYRFDRIVGTSAGALVGGLVAAGYDSVGLREAVCRIDWPELLDPSLLSKIPVVGKQLAVFFRLGLFMGDELEAAWAEMLAAKGVRTFDDLAVRLRIVATDVTHTRGLIFPDDFDRLGIDQSVFPVARALRMSAAVPFAFEPVELTNEKTGDVLLVSDGAMAANFPDRIVDPESTLPAVGFRFIEHDVHPHRVIRGPLSFAAAVIWSGIGAREGLPALASPLVDVIEVPSSRSGLDFNITRPEAKELFDEGYRSVEARLRERPLTPKLDV